MKCNFMLYSSSNCCYDLIDTLFRLITCLEVDSILPIHLPRPIWMSFGNFLSIKALLYSDQFVPSGSNVVFSFFSFFNLWTVSTTQYKFLSSYRGWYSQGEEFGNRFCFRLCNQFKARENIITISIFRWLWHTIHLDGNVLTLSGSQWVVFFFFCWSPFQQYHSCGCFIILCQVHWVTFFLFFLCCGDTNWIVSAFEYNHQIHNLQVNDHYLVVKDSTGKIIESQYIVLDNITSNMRRFYVEAYIGISPEEAPKYWLFFQVSVPPLGWNTYFISKASQKGSSSFFVLNKLPFLSRLLSFSF